MRQLLDNHNNLIATLSAKINTAEQLTLHAALGCAMGQALNGNCAGGAAGAVIGELTSNAISSNNTTIPNKQISQIAQLSGALAGAAVGGDDNAGAVYAGSMTGYNASANNDLAIYVNRQAAGGNGHMGLFVPDENKIWFQYDYYVAGNELEILSAGNVEQIEFNPIKGTFVGYEGEASLNRLGGIDDIGNIRKFLINDPNVIYIRTTPEQDKKAFYAAVNSYFNSGTYRLCTNNCADAVKNILDIANVTMPANIDPRPNVYFDNTKLLYPNNLTNESYRK